VILIIYKGETEMIFEKEILDNFIKKNYSNSTEEEKQEIIKDYRQRIAGKLKGEKIDILVIYKKNRKGFFGIDKEGFFVNT
jgi:hypothetical protein